MGMQVGLDPPMRARRALHTDLAIVGDGEVRPGPALALVRDPYGLRAERIRALRTELMAAMGPKEQACMIAVLSPARGEGRSQLAAELAVAFAQLDRATLLVDADMRRPAQQRLFEGLEADNGLAQAISRSEPPLAHAVPCYPHLSIATAGATPPNPLELLSGAGFRSLVALWRRQYDFVIFDTPPICEFADGLAVAALAGQALLVSRAHHTTYRATRSLLRRMAATESRVLGAVISHF
jgi:receptor protein-tyrosine kinase